MDLEKEIRECEMELLSSENVKDQYRVGYYSGILKILTAFKNNTCGSDTVYPQSQEPNEYRYIDPHWLDKIAIGLTAGAVNYPGESWRTIPVDEHAARAMRHINLYRAGDESDDHLINASMRIMMAYVVDRIPNDA